MISPYIYLPALAAPTPTEKTCGCGPDCRCGPGCACGPQGKCVPACTCRG